MTRSRAPARSRRTLAALAFTALAALLAPLPAAAQDDADTLRFWDVPEDSEPDAPMRLHSDGILPRAPFGERLITPADAWEEAGHGRSRTGFVLDYNRVDRVRLGGTYEAQMPGTAMPRLGARLEWAFQRERLLYGIQLEQPLGERTPYAIGVAMVRKTEHHELQQVADWENSLALLFARQDYRDYFEREGAGAYAAADLRGITTASLHFRSDEYRSLALDRGTRSLFYRHLPLRDNPPVAEGTARSWTLQLEHRLAPGALRHPGFYHWLTVERAGHGAGGEFDYVRLFGDVRSVVRLSPATTLAVRAVLGHAADGDLPPQREFVAGGVDGLRAHPVASMRGDQMFLAQAEYTLELWPFRSPVVDLGLHLIAFLDAGRVWTARDNDYDLSRQHLAADGGFGIATSGEHLRVYFARDLRDPDSDFHVTLRLQRPF